MGHSLNMIFLVQQSKTLPLLDNFHVILESTSKLLDQLKNERFLKKVIWKYVIVKSNKKFMFMFEFNFSFPHSVMHTVYLLQFWFLFILFNFHLLFSL